MRVNDARKHVLPGRIDLRATARGDVPDLHKAPVSNRDVGEDPRIASAVEDAAVDPHPLAHQGARVPSAHGDHAQVAQPSHLLDANIDRFVQPRPEAQLARPTFQPFQERALDRKGRADSDSSRSGGLFQRRCEDDLR